MESPFPEQHHTLRLLEPLDSCKESLWERLFDRTYTKPFILDGGLQRRLQFDLYTVQSAMHLDHPDRLVLAGAWTLWEKLAARGPEFGRPAVFANHIEDSKWVSFTAAVQDDTLFRLIRERTGNVPGEGGLISFPESRWLASVVIPHQPHFIGQPANVGVFWGYGLNVDLEGDFVKKPLSACSGREILTELLGHLDITLKGSKILNSATCIPCMMPFITSQFLRRGRGDRPEVTVRR